MTTLGSLWYHVTMKSQQQKRIMDDAKVKAMSKEYGVSVERIREIEAMALDRLASLAFANGVWYNSTVQSDGRWVPSSPRT